jgi:hypothetical protein
LFFAVALFDLCLFFVLLSRLPDRRRRKKDFTISTNVAGSSAMGSRTIERKLTFEQRLAEEAIRFKEAADKEKPGTMARELLLRRARQAETASRINEWLNSPGLAPPK